MLMEAIIFIREKLELLPHLPRISLLKMISLSITTSCHVAIIQFLPLSGGFCDVCAPGHMANSLTPQAGFGWSQSHVHQHREPVS